jgi:hypothetical protein
VMARLGGRAARVVAGLGARRGVLAGR